MKEMFKLGGIWFDMSRTLSMTKSALRVGGKGLVCIQLLSHWLGLLPNKDSLKLLSLFLLGQTSGAPESV